MLVSQSWLLTLLGFQEVPKYLRGAFLAARQFDPNPTQQKCLVGSDACFRSQASGKCLVGLDACFSILAAHFARLSEAASEKSIT
jgi:hypothetical protein